MKTFQEQLQLLGEQLGRVIAARMMSRPAVTADVACSVPDCGHTMKLVKGLCKLHYAKARYQGMKLPVIAKSKLAQLAVDGRSA